MEISDFNPDDMTKAAGENMAADLVNINQQALENAGLVIIGPSVDMVLENEDTYSQFYKPMLKGVRQSVAKNQQVLEKIDTHLVSQAMAKVSANSGQLTNILRKVKGLNVSASGNRIVVDSTTANTGQQSTTIGTGETLGSTGPISSVTGQLPLLRPEQPITDSIAGTPSSPTLQIGTVEPPQISTPIEGQIPTVENQQDSTQTFPTSGLVDYGKGWKACPSNGIIPFPGPSGGPSCPAGYVPVYDSVGDCYICVGSPKPPTTPQTQCYIPPPIIPPTTPLPPPCDKPSVECPQGYDWWLNPDTNKWQCTPGGLKPEPPQPTPPIIPDCQTILDRTQFSVNVNCRDLPKEYRQQLEKCGFAKCDERVAQPKEKPDDITSEFDKWYDYVCLLLTGKKCKK